MQRTHNLDPRIPLSKARALLPAIFLALVYPYYLMLFPPAGTTTSQHQTFIALYQFGPFLVYAIIQTFGTFLTKPHDDNNINTAPSDADADADADAIFVKTVYLISGIWSAVAYVATVLITVFSSDSSLSLRRIFLPAPWTVSQASPAMHIREGSFLFMQLDFIYVTAACAIYAVKTLEMMWCGGPEKMTKGDVGVNRGILGFMVLGTAVSCLLLGPGATVSAVLYARENLLRKWRSVSKGQVTTNGKA